MRVELDADGGITWIDPAAVVAVRLVAPDTTFEALPWTVRVAIGKDAPQWVEVYRNEDRAHADAVAATIATGCDRFYNEPSVHNRWPDGVPADSRLLQEPWRHSTEQPADPPRWSEPGSSAFPPPTVKR